MENEQTNTSPESPLAFFFSQLSQADKDIFDAEILNTKGIPVESLEHIKDEDVARGIMSRFRAYQEMSADASKQDLRKEAQDIADYINSKIDESLEE